MSNPITENLILPDNIIRDWKYSEPSNANQILDAGLSEAVALDLFIRNRGAAAITVSIEGMTAETVDPGDVFTVNNTIMGRINIVAAVQYDFLVTGVKFSTLRRRGLM